jgi:hypothetical protein
VQVFNLHTIRARRGDPQVENLRPLLEPAATSRQIPIAYAIGLPENVRDPQVENLRPLLEPAATSRKIPIAHAIGLPENGGPA